MRLLTGCGILVASLVVGFGCGGGSAASQYCQQYGTTLCHRAYTCTPAAMQDDTFHNEWGPSEATCASGFSMLCSQGCAGKQVNSAAETQCFADINGATCDTVNNGNVGASCEQVCVDAPVSGSGGNGGIGGGGLGGSSGGTPITDPIVFCQNSNNAICDRAFQCIPAAMRDATFTDNYGASVTACKAMTATTCVDPASNCPTYNATAGGTCVATLSSAACTDLVLFGGIFPPVACFNACGL